MQRQNIQRLIYVSDAYANLPVGDNYGLSEQVHLGIPDSFMLGLYGQSKTRAEILVRKAASKGFFLIHFLKWRQAYYVNKTRNPTRAHQHAVLKVCGNVKTWRIVGTDK